MSFCPAACLRPDVLLPVCLSDLGMLRQCPSAEPHKPPPVIFCRWPYVFLPLLLPSAIVTRPNHPAALPLSLHPLQLPGDQLCQPPPPPRRRRAPCFRSHGPLLYNCIANLNCISWSCIDDDAASKHAVDDDQPPPNPPKASPRCTALESARRCRRRKTVNAIQNEASCPLHVIHN